MMAERSSLRLCAGRKIDNRPFLHCMHGYGLSLWRLGRHPDAGRIFDRMLWLNPTDNQGVRFLIEGIQNGRAWEECQDARCARAKRWPIRSTVSGRWQCREKQRDKVRYSFFKIVQGTD
jgi:hypothetical protein